MTKFVAFLRGINVGGHTVKMTDLKQSFEELGFQNIKTILASGNVVFESSEDSSKLTPLIEKKLKDRLGFEVNTMLRSADELQSLIKTDPFKGIAVTPQTRLYVTFLADKPQSTLEVPYTSPKGDFKILSKSDREIFSVLTISPEANTTDLMSIIEKEFGRRVTTRNWNTVVRALAT